MATTTMTTDSDSRTIHTLLHSPLDFVDAQFALAVTAAQQSSSLLSQVSVSNWSIEESLIRLLGTQHPRTSPQNRLGSIASLNELTSTTVGGISSLRSGQLVRFRGMVQETLQPDYYLGVWIPNDGDHMKMCTGKYRDVLEKGPTGMNDPTGQSSTLERMTMSVDNVVPIPGESSWVATGIKKMETQSGHSYTPVTSMTPAAAAAEASSSSSPSAAPAPAKKKRPLDDDTEEKNDMDTSDSTSTAAAPGIVASTPDAKKTRVELEQASAAASASPSSLVASAPSAIAPSSNLEVLVTVYDSLATTNTPKVTQCYEFIGILTMNPDLAAAMEEQQMDSDGFGADGWNTRRREALRVHALLALPIASGFPFITHASADPVYQTQLSELRAVLPNLRQSLLAHLTSLVCGDELVGRLLLLFLLQSVHTRSATQLVGKLCMNLITPSSSATNPAEAQAFSHRLYSALEQLLPRTRNMQMNIEALNEDTWQPKKNYDTDLLESNSLHLSSPSLLYLDETTLIPGKLNGIGIRNLQVLSSMMQTSKLEYDFTYQSVMFDVEWSVLIVSSGVRSILQQEGSNSGIDLITKIVPAAVSASASSSAITPPTPAQYDYWRAYLLCARQIPYSIAQSLSSPIEEHFVSLRQLKPKTTNETTLHTILNIARLNSLSYLEAELNDQARWKEATQIYQQLQERNQQ